MRVPLQPRNSNKLSQREALVKPESKVDKLGAGVLLYAYAVLLGAAYIFSYWRPFGFEVFPYLTLQDYITAPLNRVVVIIAPPLLLLLFFIEKERDFGHGKLRLSFLYLLVMYTMAFFFAMYKAIAIFVHHEFFYTNEINVLIIATVLFTTAWILAYKFYRRGGSITLQVIAFVLVQLSQVMAAGYKDGKTVYNGAVEVFFLENKELCEKDSVRNWVYLGKFSQQVFFLNSIDKRICVTDEMKFKLIPRKFKEGL